MVGVSSCTVKCWRELSERLQLFRAMSEIKDSEMQAGDNSKMSTE